jgi:hypothetical protein
MLKWFGSLESVSQHNGPGSAAKESNMSLPCSGKQIDGSVISGNVRWAAGTWNHTYSGSRISELVAVDVDRPVFTPKDERGDDPSIGDGVAWDKLDQLGL